MQDILTVTAVSKRYGALTVTDDLSFTLKPGEALGGDRAEWCGQEHAV